jgi:hypothetical protein
MAAHVALAPPRHLFGIFYFRSLEARDPRIAKMLEDALAFADRKSRKEK